jgi:hypothetical protein
VSNYARSYEPIPQSVSDEPSTQTGAEVVDASDTTAT